MLRSNTETLRVAQSKVLFREAEHLGFAEGEH
jgi:hypothetical protein